MEHTLALTAGRTSDPLAGGLVHWTRNQTFKQAEDYTHGLRLLEKARTELDDQLRHPTPAALTVYGSLHLSSAHLASRAGDTDTTRDHLAAAHELTARLDTSDQRHSRNNAGSPRSRPDWNPKYVRRLPRWSAYTAGPIRNSPVLPPGSASPADRTIPP